MLGQERNNQWAHVNYVAALIVLAFTFLAGRVFAQSSQTFTWGEPGDVPVAGDYDGDGISDFAVWRPSTGYWYIVYSSTGAHTFRQWGAPTDHPVVGDFDGDGKADIAVWRPSTGYWYIIQSSNGAIVTKQWGASTDVPAIGDFDGDGKADIAVWRPSTGYWYIIQSSNGAVFTKQWGASADVPIVGDYDGDGKADIAVWRPSTGYWYIIQSSNKQVIAKQWGAPTDVPVVGDYDGDGKADIAVWRPSSAYWYIIYSAVDQVVTQQWGDLGDMPAQYRSVSQSGSFTTGTTTELATWRPTDGVWTITTAPPSTCVPQAGASTCNVTLYDGGQPYGGLVGPTPGTVTITQINNGVKTTTVNNLNPLGIVLFNNVNGLPLKTPPCIYNDHSCWSLAYHSFEICAIDGEFRPVTFKSVVSEVTSLNGGCTGSPELDSINTGYSLSVEGILTGTDTSTASEYSTCTTYGGADTGTLTIQNVKNDVISINLKDGSGTASISESQLEKSTDVLYPSSGFAETTSVTGTQTWPAEAVFPPQFTGTGITARTVAVPAGGALPQSCLVGSSDGASSR